MGGELSVMRELGLSQNEALVYISLLKGGRKKASELAFSLGLQRRTVYDTLSQLAKKGLVGEVSVNGVRAFSPSPPSSLLSFLDEKRDLVEEVLPLLSRPFEADEKAEASVLYGTSGIKTILEDILALRADYRVYYGQLQIFDYLPRFAGIFHEKRKRLGIMAKFMLLDLPEVRKRSRRIPNASFKFIDPSTLSAGVWWTYADRLVLIVWQKEPIAILIKNAELAKTFRESFDRMFASKTNTYHGHDGIKALLEQTLKHKETVFIGGFGAVPLRLPEYCESYYNREAEKRGHVWRNLAHRSILKTPAPEMKFHKIRFLPKHFESNPNTIWIFGNCVANVLWLPEPVAFIVEDAHIASSYKSYFELLWKTAEKK